jgi:hypothetical protein
MRYMGCALSHNKGTCLSRRLKTKLDTASLHFNFRPVFSAHLQSSSLLDGSVSRYNRGAQQLFSPIGGTALRYGVGVVSMELETA